MPAKNSPNPWGDPRAAIVQPTRSKSKPMREAGSGPTENPPSPAEPTRQRYKMAGGTNK